MLLRQILSPRANAGAVQGAFDVTRARRGLIYEMTRRDIRDRYVGQALGISWAIIAPLLTMATYVFAFTFIFRGRLGPTDNGLAYIAYILAGLVPWMAVTEGFGRSSAAITGNGNLVKQIVFPSEILPIKVALATLPSLLIGLAVVIVVSALAGRITAIGLLVLLPLSIVFYVLMVSGFCLMLASCGVFFRDIKDLVVFFVTVGLFLHPILYPPAQTPHWLWPIFMVSPLSYMIWCFRDALIGYDPTHFWSWVIFPLSSIVIFVAGWRMFRSLKPIFGNAL